MSCNVQEMSGTVPIVTNEHEVTKLKKKNKNSPRMADDLAAADCLFERLRAHQQRAPDSTEIIKTIVARISARLTSHDKGIRQTTLEKLWNPQTGAMQMLIVILESTRDVTVATYITSILREALCLKQGKGKKNAVTPETKGSQKKDNKKNIKEDIMPAAVKKANNLAREQSVQYLIAIKAPKTFMNILLEMHGKCGGNVGIDHVMNNVVWILSAFCSKDPKFANRMRELGCVRTLHLIMKGHYSDNKIIFPLLTIMKQLAKNPVTTSILVRDGIVTTYERVLNSLGFIPTARLRLCLDAIDYFSKNKVCCMQIVKTGLSNVLLRVFDRWDRYEGRMRLKICAHILQTLQHLCNIKSGRRALCTKKNVQILHRFCSNCPDQAEFDGLLARVCSVITLCLMHQSLPVPINSPATFNLNTYLKETSSYWAFQDDDDELHTSDSKSIVSDAEYDGAETELDVAFPDLDFEDSETKFEVSAEIEKQRKKAESFQSSILSAPSERDVEDLKKYFVFFKEFGSYNKQLRLVRSRSNIRGSILDEFMRVNHSPTKGSSLTNVTGVNNVINSVSDYDNTPATLLTNPLSKICENNCPSSSSSSLKVYKDLSRFSSFSSVYCTIATRVKSVVSFVKVAHPDMMSAQSLKQPEPLNKMERSACRNKLHSCVDRAINPESYLNEVVYDLDQLSSQETKSSSEVCLTNTDEQDIAKIVPGFVPTKLAFESRFESGNLRKAIQIGPREYELILMPDVNSTKRHQWFYFEVRNMQMGKPYVFNIVNCEKSDSQFNFGMKPVLYSVKESMHGRGGWIRAGTDICYYRNSYHYPNQKNTNKCYLTVTFNIDFPHSNDICYLAYHFPYTYSFMMSRIWQWSTVLSSGTYFRIDPLCYTLNNNEVPLITITADDAPANAISDREIIFLTARVHPGESNASWVMDGTLGSLLDDTAATAKLRSKYIFKIVPMLNPEGVINGCHRCGLTNEDLNRRWSKPNPVMHPSIYHTKGLIEYLVSVWKKPPLVYCDYHGHSRKKNVFFYGCASAESWCPNDRLIQDEPVKYLMLPALMHRISPAFALGSCSFRIERERESTARVTVWRHLGVTRSYTMEASFCGFDRGPFKGLHLNTQHLQNVGSDFCEALNGLGESSNTVDIQLTKDLNGNIVEISINERQGSNSEVVDSEAGTGSDSILNTDSDEDFD